MNSLMHLWSLPGNSCGEGGFVLTTHPSVALWPQPILGHAAVAIVNVFYVYCLDWSQVSSVQHHLGGRLAQERETGWEMSP